MRDRPTKLPHRHPLRQLLYVEWILLAIALLGILAPTRPEVVVRPGAPVERPGPAFERPGQIGRPRPAPRWRERAQRQSQRIRERQPNRLPLLVCLGALAISGLSVPQERWRQGIFIGLGFGLCWLTLLAAGWRGGIFFPTLLLVVALRACVMWGWWGRIPVAVLAYGSFLVPLGLRLLVWRSRAPQLPVEVAAVLEQSLLSLTLNAALLYGFVLALAIFLCSALLAARRSQEQLARANRRLRDYAHSIEDRAILQERNRIARELHDSIGHHLTAQSIQLENAALFLDEARDRAATHLATARQLGKAALADVRNSVATLRARAAELSLERPLGEAITQLLGDVTLPEPCELKSEIDPMVTASPATALVLYRILQEALTNIAKHAEARSAMVCLAQENGSICLSVTDDGCGFIPEENATGFGLQSMRERVAASGGRFELSSAPGRGCRIIVEVPEDGHSPVGG